MSNVKDYTGEEHSGHHVGTSTGSSLPISVIDQYYNNGKATNGAVINNVTSIDTTTGQTVYYPGVSINGVTYDVRTGDRIVTGGNANQQGQIPGKDWVEIDYSNNSTNVYWSSPTQYPQYSEPPGTGPVYKPSPPPPPYVPSPPPTYPPMPSQPVPEVFSVPEPTFSSDLKRESRFIYYLGVDSVKASYKKTYLNSARYFQEVALNSPQWIELEVEDYIPDNGSIEYYIVEGKKETPILPSGRNTSFNEKIFKSVPTLFSVQKVINIKKDGNVITDSYEKVKGKLDGTYSITYEAKDANRYEPKSNKIQVKAIIRMINEEEDIPYIKSLKIKAHGEEGALWQEIY